MDQIPKPANKQSENKRIINTPSVSSFSPASSVSPVAPNLPVVPPVKSTFAASSPVRPAQPLPVQPEKSPIGSELENARLELENAPAPDVVAKPSVNMGTSGNGRQFKLASTEVQGPKPPLVNSSGSKFAMIAITIIIIAILGIGGYYFYTKDNNIQPASTPVVIIPTATPIADKNLDSDKDGLPDNIEKILGTNPYKADTDGDGYNDLQEIKSGYSPLIAGPAGKYTPQEWDIVKGKIKIEDPEFYKREFETPTVSLSPSPAVSSIPLSFVCGTSTVKDTDNNIYNTVKISEQCWLKENLKVTKNAAGEAITRYCYNNDPKICETDGGLYDWNTAMNKSTAEGAQGICPNDWHVPKDSEWYVLEKGLATGSCSANRTGPDCYSVGTEIQKSGSSEFGAVLAGFRNPHGPFDSQSKDARFWTSKENDIFAWDRELYSMDSMIYRTANDKRDSLSVRCLKN